MINPVNSMELKSKNINLLRLIGFFLLLSLPCTVVAQSTQLENIPPKVYQSAYPIYPREHLLSGKGGKVTVQIKIDRHGKVVGGAIKEATDPLFKQAVMQAIQVWEFNPCIRDGKPAPSKVLQTFSFQANRHSYFSIQPLKPDPNAPHPYPTSNPRPTYPESLKRDKTQGYADIIVTVNKEGKVTDAKIEKATHVLFGEYALATANKWSFKPSKENLRAWRLTLVFRP